MIKEPADSILLVEDNTSLRQVLEQVLSMDGFQVTSTETAEEAIEHLKESECTLILSDLKLPQQSGIDLVREARVINKNIPVLVMTAYGSIDIAVEAMKTGAIDFITKPFDPAELCLLVHQIIEHRHMLDRAMGRSKKRARTFLTQSPEVESMLEQARKVSILSSPVLILGESGTGKELVARYIHDHSTRAESPFIPVNCGSMPSELLESEFFGHEAGAFTGATDQRTGLFEVADSGTIFLDEIGNMPPSLQAKLLRALQESEIKRLGSTAFKKIDVRVISATNCKIEKVIQSGEFREDLYYRLGVVILEIPPLRERPEDIGLLAKYFVKSLCHEFRTEPRSITPAAMKFLQRYPWPGNVRELENAVERALIFSDGDLTPESFELTSLKGCLKDPTPKRSLQDVVQETVRKTEMEMISKVLTETYGNKSRAAEILGVSYKTLLNKVKEYKLDARQEPAAEAAT